MWKRVGRIWEIIYRPLLVVWFSINIDCAARSTLPVYVTRKCIYNEAALIKQTAHWIRLLSKHSVKWLVRYSTLALAIFIIIKEIIIKGKGNNCTMYSDSLHIQDVNRRNNTGSCVAIFTLYLSYIDKMTSVSFREFNIQPRVQIQQPFLL